MLGKNKFIVNHMSAISASRYNDLRLSFHLRAPVIHDSRKASEGDNGYVYSLLIMCSLINCTIEDCFQI